MGVPPKSSKSFLKHIVTWGSFILRNPRIEIYDDIWLLFALLGCIMHCYVLLLKLALLLVSS